MYKAASGGKTKEREGSFSPTKGDTTMENRTENRSSNRTSNCREQSQNRTENRTENRTTNEHKHPNQYTKGADDEGAKNKK